MNQEINQTRKYLYNHTTQENAYEVDNYPWGFRLRTKIRYWIETSEKKNGGQRFCSQTINPKNGKWCTPKKTTYSPVMIMFLNEDEHIKYECVSMGSRNETIRNFIETHENYLTEFQKDQLKEMIAINNVMEHVTFEFVPSPMISVSLLSKDPEEVRKREMLIKQQEEREKEREKTFRKINFAISVEKNKITL